jgi:hypothetical protein
MPAAAPGGDCDDCHSMPGAACLMSPVGQATGEGDLAAARHRPRVADPAMEPLLVLPPLPVTPVAAPAPLHRSGPAASGRRTGDPPWHLRLGRLHI